MTTLGRLCGLFAMVAALGCGNSDLNKDLKPVDPAAKPFKATDGNPNAKQGIETGSQTQKVITK